MTCGFASRLALSGSAHNRRAHLWEQGRLRRSESILPTLALQGSIYRKNASLRGMTHQRPSGHCEEPKDTTQLQLTPKEKRRLSGFAVSFESCYNLDQGRSTSTETKQR